MLRLPVLHRQQGPPDAPLPHAHGGAAAPVPHLQEELQAASAPADAPHRPQAALIHDVNETICPSLEVARFSRSVRQAAQVLRLSLLHGGQVAAEQTLPDAHGREALPVRHLQQAVQTALPPADPPHCPQDQAGLLKAKAALPPLFLMMG
ncbi:unnamed protein product [Larinioides sclopetarius]|uniref:Uncharacterized protein n=1 Tax=Larinioides sclopetarius TaxID=280406 RepID=A0AAV2BUD7_9ARAC